MPWLVPAQLHYRSNVPGEVQVKQMIKYFEEHPDQVKAQNADGYLPLHCAAGWQEGETGVRAVMWLLDAYPEGAQVECGHSLPLHFAAGNRQEEHFQVVAKALIKAYPEGVSYQKTVCPGKDGEPVSSGYPINRVHRGLSDESVQLLKVPVAAENGMGRAEPPPRKHRPLPPPRM